MSEREALGAFQRRLSDRLQAAPGDAGGGRALWLGVEAGGDRYLLPLAQSGEIFPVAAVHAVPYAQAWFVGVANLRGAVFGVVDLARFMAGEARRRQREALLGESRLIALGAVLEVQCALRVDRLLGLRGPGDFTTSAPASPGGPAWLGALHADGAGLSWQVLDLAVLAQEPRFLMVST